MSDKPSIPSSMMIEDYARKWSTFSNDRVAQHFYEGALFMRTEMTKALTAANARIAKLEAKLALLRRYHGGDGSITREQIIEVLGEETK